MPDFRSLASESATTLSAFEATLRSIPDADLHRADPDGGWTIFTIIHHLAGAELYYATSLESVLPSDTAQRLQEAAERVQVAAEREIKRTLQPNEFYFYNEAESSLSALLDTVLKQQQAI